MIGFRRHMMDVALAALIGGWAWLATPQNAMAASVVSLDHIYLSQRSHFNGFEAISSDILTATSYTEQGIAVSQINGDLTGILTSHDPGGRMGIRTWSPQGGDHGYTRITRQSGGDFWDVGMLTGSSMPGQATLLFDLFNNGSSAQSGSLNHSLSFSYLGFLGGGFDEIRLRDAAISSAKFNDGSFNALALDSIELRDVSAVPLPAALPLFLTGLAGLGLIGRKRAKAVGGGLR